MAKAHHKIPLVVPDYSCRRLITSIIQIAIIDTYKSLESSPLHDQQVYFSVQPRCKHVVSPRIVMDLKMRLEQITRHGRR